MNLQSLNERPRLAMALQLALLMLVFQGVIATTPGIPAGPELTVAVRPVGGSLAPAPL